MTVPLAKLGLCERNTQQGMLQPLPLQASSCRNGGSTVLSYKKRCFMYLFDL
jgi:hypothetical protein